MEIFIKKSKLTKSIFDQSHGVSQSDITSYEVLGFVFYKGVNWIVFYNKETGLVKRLLMFIRTEKIVEERAFVNVIFGNKYIPKRFYMEEDKLDGFIEVLERVRKEAKEKGQFYL